MVSSVINPIIRSERKEDYAQIILINNFAFEQLNEGILIKQLRETEKYISELSLVIEYQDKLIGHILFYPLDIVSEDRRFEVLSLAPMAVLPEYQKQGLGGKLVEAGLRKALQLGFSAVVVLGHPEYYPKFGFERSSKWNIQPPIEIPDEAFMITELVDGWLSGKVGVVEFPAEYYDAM